MLSAHSRANTTVPIYVQYLLSNGAMLLLVVPRYPGTLASRLPIQGLVTPIYPTHVM